MYGKRAPVGEAFRESGLERGEVFITSKLNNGYHEYDAALQAFDTSLAVMELDYLDLS